MSKFKTCNLRKLSFLIFFNVAIDFWMSENRHLVKMRLSLSKGFQMKKEIKLRNVRKQTQGGNSNNDKSE